MKRSGKNGPEAPRLEGRAGQGWWSEPSRVSLEVGVQIGAGGGESRPLLAIRTWPRAVPVAPHILGGPRDLAGSGGLVGHCWLGGGYTPSPPAASSLPHSGLAWVA